MSKLQTFQDFVYGRLAAAALDILGQYEKTLAEYQEICRSKEQSAPRMFDITGILPEIKRHITGVTRLSLPESPLIKEEQDLWTSRRGRQLLFPEPLQIKEEQDMWTSQGGEQLQRPPSDTQYYSISRVKMHGYPGGSSQLLPLDPSPIVENRATGTTKEQASAKCDEEEYGAPELPSDTHSHAVVMGVLIKADSDEEDLGTPEPASDSQPLFVSPDCPTAQSLEELEGRGRLPEVKACCIKPEITSTPIPSPWSRPISSPSTENESEVISFKVKAAEKPYQCEACGKAFSDRAGLVRHRRSHTGEKPYQCEECGKAYSDQSGLARHRRVHTGVKPYTCEACGKAFRQRSSFVEHIKIHTGIRPYQCDECDKAFRQKSNLLKHKRIHTGERPYQCEECGLAFTLKSNLLNHRRLHTGERPYQCEVCDKAFHEPSSLVAHRRSHTGERPYQCEICEKAFSQKGNLVKHRRVHTGEKPYQCEECGRSFSDRGNLICHKRIHAGKPWRRLTSVHDG